MTSDDFTKKLSCSLSLSLYYFRQCLTLFLSHTISPLLSFIPRVPLFVSRSARFTLSKISINFLPNYSTFVGVEGTHSFLTRFIKLLVFHLHSLYSSIMPFFLVFSHQVPFGMRLSFSFTSFSIVFFHQASLFIHPKTVTPHTSSAHS